MVLLQRSKRRRQLARTARVPRKNAAQRRKISQASAKAPPPAKNPPSLPKTDEDDEVQDLECAHRAVVGHRYMVPESEFFEEGDDEVYRYGVVCWQRRNVVQMWFDGDDRVTTYKDRLEEWTDFFL